MTALASSDQTARRTRVLVWLLAAPTVITVCGVIAVEGWRLLRPDSSLFTAPFVYSLADAIEGDDVLAAYEFIRRGQDPNDLIAVRHPVLTGGQSRLASPLLWAVATQSKDAVRMLLAFGVRIDRPADRQAACLAAALGNKDISAILSLYGGAPPAPCAEQNPGDVPLLSILESP